MQPIIITSDKTSWALRPQAYLLHKYWRDASFLIGGYTAPSFRLPDGFTFHSIGAFADYPVGKWSDGLIAFLLSLSDDLVLLLLDDYWPFRDVDSRAIEELTYYMMAHDSVARLCTCTDRLYASGIQDYGHYGHLDLIRSDPHSPYHFSFQASLWRRKMLLECLAPNETPWQAEDNGNARLRDAGYLVLGTRQAPMRYTIAIQRGVFSPDGGYQSPNAAMNPEDVQYILEHDWLPK